MSKTDTLRVADVQGVYRLIGDCRDLGGDPVLWQPRMLEGLSRLVGDSPATGGEGVLVGGQHAIVTLTHFDYGLDAAQQRNYLGYIQDNGPANDPFVGALQPAPGKPVTRLPRQVVSNAVYRRAAVFDRHLRPGDVYYRLASMSKTMDRSICLLHLQRGSRERDFSPRDQAILELFHRELGPLVGRALISATEPTPMNLPRRLRQTLACLVEGDTEKQVASRLRVSHATAHQYVTALYRRFGVSGRAQLLAHVIKRIARREWRDGLDL